MDEMKEGGSGGHVLVDNTFLDIIDKEEEVSKHDRRPYEWEILWALL
jgi:hypothetical protein